MILLRLLIEPAIAPKPVKVSIKAIFFSINPGVISRKAGSLTKMAAPSITDL
jgi:hypothetical protein